MIQWENTENKLPIKSWCVEMDEKTLEQAKNLANHPVIRERICLMPDAHVGYGMPIGGVIACEDAVIPNAVGVDIGCGMGAIKTNLNTGQFTGMAHLREISNAIKERIPAGEGHARKKIEWEGFENWLASLGSEVPPAWFTKDGHKLDMFNLGTLGGGNHFIEIQKAENGDVWIMLHSGSRNMGQRVASYYHKEAVKLLDEMGIELPDRHLAFLPTTNKMGQDYIRDMNHALLYAFVCF
jgi:tRNA-splicing ligase RtcB